MYEVAGKIKVIFDVQSFASGFTKREFVVTTAHDKFPQDLKFEAVKDKCAMLDAFQAGQDVQVNFDIRGNEYNGKYFVNLSCWKIQAAGQSESQQAPARSAERSRQTPSAPARPVSSSEPTAADLRNEDDFDDDIPF